MNARNKNLLYDICITVNDREIRGTVRAETSLLDFLRDNNFTEVKRGCDKGDCGACTVIKDGRAILSCITLALQAEGSKVYTVKSLGSWDKMHPLQQAFVDYEALQCGFCTPGMIMSACGLLKEHPKPTRQQIVDSLDDNLCRCGAHNRIVKAVEMAAEATGKGAKS